MVSEKKRQKLKEVREDLGKYPVIGIIDMFKLPGKQLHEIRNRLRNDAVIKMVKKRIIKLALKDCGLNGIEELEGYVRGEPALLLSRTNPFRLARTIGSSKSKAFAKAGDTAPMDIVVRAGPTSLSPGPVIGELQRAKIPAAVEGEKIKITKDTLVAREGGVIEKPLADVLVKLGIEPIEIGLNLLAAWEGGHVYPGELLFTPAEKYIEDLKAAGMQAFNLSCSVNYYTGDNIPFFLSKAYQEARSLAEAADVLTGETVKPILAKARARAETLRGMAGEAKEEPKETKGKPKEEKETPEEDKEEKKEEKPEEKKKEPGKKGKKEKAKKDDDKKKGK